LEGDDQWRILLQRSSLVEWYAATSFILSPIPDDGITGGSPQVIIQNLFMVLSGFPDVSLC
jgi:hypothetical protein